MKKLILSLLSVVVLCSSCVVSKRKYEDLQNSKNTLQAQTDAMAKELGDCKNFSDSLESEIVVRGTVLEEQKQQYVSLQQKLDEFQKTNSNLLTRLSDFSIVDEKGAESIRESLQKINEQNAYIADMTQTMKRKDSLNNMLIMKLKRSLVNVNDSDVSVQVKKGVVYISLSDKMLYRSGSSRLNSGADTVLAKIAKIINDHQGYEVLVEGHTDNVPIGNIDCMEDNWDLSAKRAISVVRALQTKYGVAPERLTAGGRSYYEPKNDNLTEANRSQNRRTDIIILPKLDQFFEMMEPETTAGGSN